MPDQLFTTEQYVDRPRGHVFAFFSQPRNLEAITPAWLDFRIVHQSTERLGEGTEITYRLRIHGLPVTWKSRIDAWQENERFVDVQLRGPYAKWRHTHEFHDRDGGTLIRDNVEYRLPLGRLGQWVGGGFVASDVKKIFEYRTARTAALLRKGSAS